MIIKIATAKKIAWFFRRDWAETIKIAEDANMKTIIVRIF